MVVSFWVFRRVMTMQGCSAASLLAMTRSNKLHGKFLHPLHFLMALLFQCDRGRAGRQLPSISRGLPVNARAWQVARPAPTAPHPCREFRNHYAP